MLAVTEKKSMCRASKTKCSTQRGREQGIRDKLGDKGRGRRGRAQVEWGTGICPRGTKDGLWIERRQM